MLARMDRRLVSGTVAGLAAVLLATGGGTFAAFDDAVDVPHNTAGAGVLLLDLGGTGSADAGLSFAGLMPGRRSTRLRWIHIGAVTTATAPTRCQPPFSNRSGMSSTTTSRAR